MFRGQKDREPNLVDPPASFKSPVWQYFGFAQITSDKGVRETDKTKSICKICKGSVSYSSGNNSNMSTHLKRKRPEITLQKPESKPKNPTAEQAKAKPQTASNLTTSTPGQLRLHEVMQSKLSQNSPRAQLITKAIGIFMAKDLRPYSVVENPGFKKLVSVLEPRYNMPSRVHFSKTVVPNLYDEVKSEVQSDLRWASHVALTSNGWTSRATGSYVTITAHYINTDWVLCNNVLQTRVLGDSHTGHNLAEVYNTAIREWNLKRNDMNPVITTDNASNVINAAKEADMLHVTCFAHTINLAAQKGMQVGQMERLLGRASRILILPQK